MLNWKVFLLVLTAGIFAHCEGPVCCEPDEPPFTAIIFSSEGNDYLAQHAGDSVTLYYFENDEKINLNPVIQSFKDTTYLSEPNIIIPSGSGKDYYLQVANDIDTISISRDKKSKEIEKVLLNGKLGEKIVSSTSAPYFHLIKK